MPLGREKLSRLEVSFERDVGRGGRSFAGREEAEPRPWRGGWAGPGPHVSHRSLMMEAPPKQRAGLAKALIESQSLFQLTVVMNLFRLTSGFQQTAAPCCKTLYDQLGPTRGLGPISYSLVLHQKDPFFCISHNQIQCSSLFVPLKVF